MKKTFKRVLTAALTLSLVISMSAVTAGAKENLAASASTSSTSKTDSKDTSSTKTDSKSSQTKTTAITYEGEGYDSAEDAMTAFAEAFADKDLQAMANTFAIETYVENYDLEASIDRTKAYLPAMTMNISNDNSMANQILITKRLAEVNNYIEYQYNVITNTGYFSTGNTGSPVALSDYDDAADLIEKELSGGKNFDSAKIVIGDFMDPAELSDKYDTKDNQDNMLKIAKCAGAEDVADTAISLTIDGEDYILFMESYCYDGTWYNYAPNGMLATLCGLSTQNGGLAKLSDYKN